MSLSQAGLNLGGFLSHLARRQEVISSNIANTDTPGYQTRDITAPHSFAEILNGSVGDIHDAPGLANRNDGNNVSVDREARLLTENTLRFNLVTQMLRGELKSIRSAIQEGK